ncbi:MAG TPA: DUF2961 domain-containing protein, partial [bacterium]|nr:DUF2961 domain-containing protein [bacterium]
SFFGTGSEDYYNYSWSSPEIWQTPYAGQPRNDGPGNRGFVTNHRWHILDPLPFRRSLHFYMEMFSHQRTDSISYARISYHYARPGAIDEHVPISGEDVRAPERTCWMPVAAFGAANATFYQTEDLVGPASYTSLEYGNLWAGGRLFVWHPREQNDELTLTLPVEEDGTYRLAFTVARTPNSGAMEITLDDALLEFGEEARIDLRQPYRHLLRTVYTGTLQLEKGSHLLTLKNISEDTNQEIGIDFIWVQKRE